MILAVSPDFVTEIKEEQIECSKCGKATKGYKGENGETVCFSHRKKEKFSFAKMKWE